MKTIKKKITKKSSFVVGRQLPDKLPKKAEEFLANAVTPKRAFEICGKSGKDCGKEPSRILKQASSFPSVP